ncbi:MULTISPECIES: hypothetical protein [unclassified Emticicia]|uniref:hypothetical protein n=1 Tax=unclassified Emticicia TaxID=2627301 RepID=UPI000CC76A01|nr:MULTISPECIES: hypothetical protein [unclassified Emticicia]PLK46260.1 hypothetical protein C0V77_02635 [Emticicia sp. TH156]UTA68045.1 hypothetical protein MB380_20975 [Emticicia sp. 21SJ11W-3]
MKKLMLKFADNLLSKEQMKGVVGGDWWEDYNAITYGCHDCSGGSSTPPTPANPGHPGGGCTKITTKSYTDPATGSTYYTEYYDWAPCGTPGYH